WLRRYNTCPNECPAISHKDIVSAPKVLLKALHDLKIRCDFHTNGCKSVLKLRELSEHRQSCGFKAPEPQDPQQLCDTCGQSYSAVGADTRRHNCIESLKRKLDVIHTENHRLCRENNEIKSELDLMKLIAHSTDDESHTHDYTGRYELTRSINHDQILRKVGAGQTYIDHWNSQKHSVQISRFGDAYCMTTGNG
ncbi:unnamed protein product, partial [Medioppia subpectinata]